ncbi:glutamate racemase [Campylobacter concisus]|uniref:Glutamate racemase n=1 Tax=Campylobacter concisus ATCC 51562 TaxID=1242969 RepID=U2GI53_9BACT|nr:glutamate racemase [Campylobacter concisus]ERJ25663.1 Glutamate racemase [Campylobacter concisus ATCC 51562]
MKIGIFDSGLGGLSVLNEALSKLSEHEFLYYADVKNVPYGQKSRNEILKFSFDAVKFLIENGAKAVVVACNTATSVAIKELRANLSIPIIGMEPAVKKAHDLSHNDTLKTLVIATPVTVNGAKLKELIANLHAKDKTELLALPRLVNFAENGEFDTENVKSYLKEELDKFDLSKFGFLVLGCTHFNYFKDSLREILPSNISIIDGNEGTINRLISEIGLKISTLNKAPKIRFFYSGDEVFSKFELDKISRNLTHLEKMRAIC